MFCPKCGNDVAGVSFCPKCGTPVDNTSAQPSTYQPYPAYGSPAPRPAAHYAPGSYIERLHAFGGSTTFLVGIILFSAGKLLSIFMAFNWMSFFSLLFLAVPVTGFWLIFAASKAPCMPEKTLPALTLFKTSIIIDLVVSCFYGLMFLIIAAALFVAASAVSGIGSYYGGGEGAGILGFIGFISLVAAGVVVMVAIIYFRAVMQTLGGIRDSIMNNSFRPLPGIRLFTIFTYISVGLSAIGELSTLALSAATSSVLNEVIYQLPSELRGIARGLIGGGITFGPLFSLTGLAGAVVCVVVLNQFNNSLCKDTRP